MSEKRVLTSQVFCVCMNVYTSIYAGVCVCVCVHVSVCMCVCVWCVCVREREREREYLIAHVCMHAALTIVCVCVCVCVCTGSILRWPATKQGAGQHPGQPHEGDASESGAQVITSPRTHLLQTTPSFRTLIFRTHFNKTISFLQSLIPPDPYLFYLCVCHNCLSCRCFCWLNYLKDFLILHSPVRGNLGRGGGRGKTPN